MSAFGRKPATEKGTSSRKTVNSGFTLVELLVVIAIIALLMAILMPALTIVREQARSITCRSNVRQLLYGWMMYSDENDDNLIRGFTDNSKDWTIGASGTLEEHKQMIRDGMLWPYIKDVDVYHCLSDRRKKIPKHNNAWRTYSIAGGMNGVNPGQFEIIAYTRASEIKRPADKYVFLAECDRRGYNMGSWVLNPKSERWVDPLGVWHRDDANTLGFADGHVDMYKYRGRGFMKWNLLALYDPDAFGFGRTPVGAEELADFKYMRDHYPYKALAK